MKPWYYLDSRQQKIGPLSDAQLDVLFHQGQITVDTLVWNQEMSDWQPLKNVYEHKENMDRATGWNIFLYYALGAVSIFALFAFFKVSMTRTMSTLEIIVAIFLVPGAIGMFASARNLQKKKQQIQTLLRDGRQ